LKHCAFLTLDDPTGFVIDDELAHEPLAELGWQVSWPSWRQSERPWSDFDAVIIRSPWDYQAHSEAFVQVLEIIDSSGTRLANPLDIVHWNLSKTYLKELEDKGVPIVPSLWGNAVEAEDFSNFAESLCTSEVVIKPVIGANGDDTFRVVPGDDSDFLHRIAAIHNGRDFMVQPFMPNILSEGEYSIFYFNGCYSHAILKTPAAGEFRSQEERGSSLAAVMAKGRLRQRADMAMDAVASVVPETLLYARIDLVRDEQDDFRLMEAELIEPALYLRMDTGAPMRFARAIDEWYKAG
jgi:glutathione synthase/RimK-type ligase-like ATP-grasp enzyme